MGDDKIVFAGGAEHAAMVARFGHRARALSFWIFNAASDAAADAAGGIRMYDFAARCGWTLNNTGVNAAADGPRSSVRTGHPR